jgi:hypothetical protein
MIILSNILYNLNPIHIYIYRYLKITKFSNVNPYFFFVMGNNAEPKLNMDIECWNSALNARRSKIWDTQIWMKPKN